MSSFNETMAIMYVDYYNKHGEEQTYKFVLSTHVALSVPNSLYETFLLDGIDELSKLPEITRQKFWDIGCKYFDTMGDRMKACKAIYALSLITAN